MKGVKMKIKDEFIKLYEALAPDQKAPLLFAMKILAAGAGQNKETQNDKKASFVNK